jgi:hypothetical protein
MVSSILQQQVGATRRTCAKRRIMPMFSLASSNVTWSLTLVLWADQAVAVERLAAWRIGTKIRQEPCGLIVPSTILQAFGGWNCAHLSQRLSPSG